MSISQSVYVSWAPGEFAWKERIASYFSDAGIEVSVTDAPQYQLASEARERCHVFVLLVSRAYLALSEIQKTEFPHIRSLSAKEKRRIVYVILERCAWRAVLTSPAEPTIVIPKEERVLAEESEEQVREDLDALVAEVRRALGETTGIGQSEEQESSIADSGTEPARTRRPSVAKKKTKSDDWITQETFDRFSTDAIEMLSRAARVAKERKSERIHTVHLLGGFREQVDHGDSASALRRFLKENEKNLTEALNYSYRPHGADRMDVPLLEGPPKVSLNARRALLTAIEKAGTTGRIEEAHILFGLLSTTTNERVRKLNERGMTADKVPVPAADEVAKTATPNETQGQSEQPQPDWIKQETFERFSPGAVEVLSRASLLRDGPDGGRIHTRHVLEAFAVQVEQGDIARELADFIKAHRASLSQVLGGLGGWRGGGDHVPLLERPPSVSDNVGKALLTAVVKAGNTGQIEDSHILFGVLSTASNARVQELNKRGMTPDKVPLPIPLPKPAPRSAPTPKIVSDLWSEEDLLGYGAYARTLAGIIAHKETVPPLSIGIKAPWGAGKTSLMKQLQRILDGRADITEENSSAAINKDIATTSLSIRQLRDKLRGEIDVGPLEPVASKLGKLYDISPLITVWFNAWKYQTSEQIWAGLAHCIISQVTARMTAGQRELFWLKLNAARVNKEAVRKRIYGVLLRYLAPIALIGLVASVLMAWLLPIAGVTALWSKAVVPVITVLTMIWKRREKLGEKAADAFKDLVREPDYEGKMGFLHLVESDIREVLNLVATKERPLVIFVDDLDRCVPRKVAEVVEAINLSLCGDYPNCIFVLGMESGMVAAALEVANKEVIEKAKQLSLLDTTIPLGWRFMEKIVQLPISIPPPTDAGLRGYAASLTGSAIPDEESQEGETEPETPNLPAKEKIEEYKAKLEPLQNASEVASAAKQLMEEAPAEERVAVAEASKQKYAEKLVKRDPLVRKFVEDVFALVGGNPRQIKRYINVFRFHSTLRFNFERDLEARGLKAKLASDNGLAKFIAMTIQWPQAPEFLKKTYAAPADGERKVMLETMLKALERKSQTLKGQLEKADIDWAEFLKGAGLGNVEWMATRAFREFLVDGEALSEMEGCGLW